MKVHALGFLLILGVTQAVFFSRKEWSFTPTFIKNVYSYNNDASNVVCSPLSSYLLLAQATYGADGNTAKQLRNVLELPKNDSYELKRFEKLREDLQNITGVKFYSASRLIIYKDLKLNKTYSKLMKRSFGSGIKIFTGSAADLADNVNRWVDNKTNNLIDKMIYPANRQEDDITYLRSLHYLLQEKNFEMSDIDKKTTKLIFLNAVSFNAEWLYPFSTTDILPFTHLNNTVHKVPTMVSRFLGLTYGKIEDVNAHYVELPFKNKNFKMVIIVHDKENITEAEFNELGDYLYRNKYNPTFSSSYVDDVIVSLPIFKIQSLINHEPVLKAMNADEMFTDKANFQKLSKNLTVNEQNAKILQKVVLRIVDMGVGEGLDRTFPDSYSMTTQDRINVNIPFYFAIKSSHGILFHGRVKSLHYITGMY